VRDLGELKSPGMFGNGALADNRRYEFDFKNGVIYTNETPVDICFIGDSITNFWELNAYFRDYGFVVNRGIGGDIVETMKKRFEADVIQLKPRVCVMMIGVNNAWHLKEVDENDIALYKQKDTETFELLKNNYIEIIEIAKAANIPLIVCSLTPCNHPPKINDLFKRVNIMLNDLCNKNEIPYVDYHSRMLNSDKTAIDWAYTGDGVHPNVYGYNVMAETLRHELDKFFKK